MGKDRSEMQIKCKTDRYGAGVCELKVKEEGKSADCLIKIDECGNVEVACTGDKSVLSKMNEK